MLFLIFAWPITERVNDPSSGGKHCARASPPSVGILQYNMLGGGGGRRYKTQF